MELFSLILVVTHSKDVSADLVIRHLLAFGRAYTRLDTDKLGTPDCFFGSSSEPELHIGKRMIPVSDITAIWARRFALPEALHQVKPAHLDFVRRELATVMDAYLEGTPDTFQINTSNADRLAGNRILQEKRAKAAGLLVPDTLVTQDHMEAQAFLEMHANVLCKALSFGRVSSTPHVELVAYASKISRDHSLEGLISCPSLFQEDIPKRYDWRITTVGDRSFSARASFHPGVSPTDWREEQNAATRFVRADPPKDVLAKLFRLARESGIVYGAHDLIETPRGEFYFLETNPAGQWGWLELTIGLPIGQAIAEELAKHSPVEVL